MRSIIGGTLITRKGRLISSLGVRSEPQVRDGVGVSSIPPSAQCPADFLKPDSALQKAELPADSTLPLTNTNYHFPFTWSSPPRRTALAQLITGQAQSLGSRRD